LKARGLVSTLEPIQCFPDLSLCFQSQLVPLRGGSLQQKLHELQGWGKKLDFERAFKIGSNVAAVGRVGWDTTFHFSLFFARTVIIKTRFN
jgi:hypothetical protein